MKEQRSKEKIKEKLLTANKGKFIVHYKKIWSHGDTNDHVPTDTLMTLKNEDNLEKFKFDIINKLKSLGFSLKVSLISGGESLNFESVQSTSDNKSQSFKIPVKLYVKSKKIMVQGTLDCQNLFMRHFKDISVHQEMKEPLILDKSHLASTDSVVNDVLAQPPTQLSLHTDSMSIQSSTAPKSRNPTTYVNKKSSDFKSKSLANTSATLMSSRLLSVTSFPAPLNTSMATKLLERGRLVLMLSRVTQITQIKETVSCLESEFVSFKINTDNRLADSVNNEMVQDKITAIHQQHKLDIRNLKSRVSDLESPNDTLMKKLKILEDQNKQQFRNNRKLET